MTSYDTWKTTPPEGPEQEDCGECEGTGKVFSDEARAKLVRVARTCTPSGLVKFIDTLEQEDCERCEGTGLVDPPTREEIKEEMEERRGEQLREEGRL